MTIILGSSSRYRQALLARLNIKADAIAPNIDESPHTGETPELLALRLAIEKAESVRQKIAPLGHSQVRRDQEHHNPATIISSDQVASIGTQLLGKPGNHQKACEQLQQQSGKCVVFYTALCVQQGDKRLTDVIATTVEFRLLTPDEITQYVTLEQPLDCAGSFKSEGLGITLFNRITSDDPSALVGLPLIRTTQFLREFGHNPLTTQA